LGDGLPASRRCYLLERAAINGGGSNEPTGIIANTDVTVTFAGNAAVVGTNANGANQVYADWVNLYKAAMVNNATMQNLAYITSLRCMQMR
jgi:hypothetical protein